MTTEDTSHFPPGCTVRVVRNSRDFLPDGVVIGGEYWLKFSSRMAGVNYVTLNVPYHGKMMPATMYEQDVELVEAPPNSLSADWTGAPDTTAGDTW